MIYGSFCEIALSKTTTVSIGAKLARVQELTCCCQARSHYLNVCWSRSMSPYGVTKTQRVNSSRQWHLALGLRRKCQCYHANIVIITLVLLTKHMCHFRSKEVKLIIIVKCYHETSNISRTKSQSVNVFRLVLQLSLPNPLKPCVKSRMEVPLEQRRQAMPKYIWMINIFIAY